MAIERFAGEHILDLLNQALQSGNYTRLEAFRKFYSLFRSLVTTGFEDYPLDDYIADYGEAAERGELEDLERAIISVLKSSSTEGRERLTQAKELYLALEEYIVTLNANEAMEPLEEVAESTRIEILDEGRRLIRIGKKTITFPPRPFKIFLALLSKEGGVVSHEELKQIVGIPESQEGPLSSAIGNIRVVLKKELGADFPAELFVQNVRGAGYRLNLSALGREG